MSMMERFVSKFKKEGVDHVRVSVIAETQVGKLASADWRKRFYIPRVGEFLSPTCFANWLASGDEEARHNPRFRVSRSIKGYHKYVLYAKFYQLCGMRAALVKEGELLKLPFTTYKVHQSGIKEFDRWTEYPSKVKEMIEHIVDKDRGPKVPFAWENGLEEEVNAIIAAIAAASTADDEEEVSVSTEEVQSVEEVVEETTEESQDDEEVTEK